MHVRIPTFISWGDYRRISADLDKRVSNDLAEASKIFDSVKNQVHSLGLQGPFFNHIKKVSTANMITTKVRAKRTHNCSSFLVTFDDGSSEKAHLRKRGGALYLSYLQASLN